jgi:cytochrome c-type biogenesis protein CcmF
MSFAGTSSLVIAFIAIVVSVVAFLLGHFYTGAVKKSARDAKERNETLANRFALIGNVSVLVTALSLTFGCALILYCFLSGDVSLEYVVHYQSDSNSDLAVLYKISGLWGGREGSLLFWAWLIGVFGAVVAFRNLKKREELDNMTLLVIQIVILAFVGVLLFSPDNMPFTPIDPFYLNAEGTLKPYTQLMQEYLESGSQSPNPGLVLGMNVLLEHWAMAIHPPTLFVGYAGLTVPFAYAIAALIVNDPSKKWVESAQRYALFSWVFLGIGIGLGAIWAYVVLGWGGYWGWDPVENASLLSWILAVALVHNFTVYRQRGAFKRWAVMTACMAFAFVIVGTFIARSGIVQNSVHAFEGDTVSLVLFAALIILSVLAGLVGLIIRWESFGAKEDNEELMENLVSRGVAYYFNNVVLVVSAVLITYLTIASALPAGLPYGGYSLPASTYNAIARPLGILYCLIMAVCPLLGWVKTDKGEFLKRLKIPGIAAVVLFAVLIFYFVTYLAPSYDAMIAVGGSRAVTMQEAGPRFYYFLITIVGFLAASLLFFNSLVMLGRIVSSHAKAKGTNVFVAFFSAIHNRASTFGGFLAHLSIAVILVGLIGSSMYVTETSTYLPFDEDSDTASADVSIQDYRLVFIESNIEPQDNGDDTLYAVAFDVYKEERLVGRVDPGIYFVDSSQQRKPLAGVLSSPLEDLFVVYNGVTEDGSLSINAFVNPCISLVWVGFGLLMVGTIIATVGRRKPKVKSSDTAEK